MQEKTLKLEISHTTSSGKVHYGTLELPASELELEDSLQQARTNDALNIIGEYVNITSCDEDEGMGMFLRQ